MQQVDDLASEGRELRDLLEPLHPAEWDIITQFKGWSINDVVLHLHIGNVQAVLSATDPQAYLDIRRDILGRRQSGMSSIEETRDRLKGLHGRKLLGAWQQQLDLLCKLLAAMPPDTRLKWNGPDMSARMFTTARQMEHWAHAQEVYDILGRPRRFHERLKNVAFIGVRTFGFSFSNRGLPVPPEPPHVRLTSPGGVVWEWNRPSETSLVTGDAVEFCQVVAQTRNVADTKLSVTGETAHAWMAIAQCFGGPPNDPPAPGTRFMVRRTPA